MGGHGVRIDKAQPLFKQSLRLKITNPDSGGQGVQSPLGNGFHQADDLLQCGGHWLDIAQKVVFIGVAQLRVLQSCQVEGDLQGHTVLSPGQLNTLSHELVVPRQGCADLPRGIQRYGVAARAIPAAGLDQVQRQQHHRHPRSDQQGDMHWVLIPLNSDHRGLPPQGVSTARSGRRCSRHW